MSNLKITVKIEKLNNYTLIPHLNQRDALIWIPEGGTIKKIAPVPANPDLFSEGPTILSGNSDHWNTVVTDVSKGTEAYYLIVQPSNSPAKLKVNHELVIDPAGETMNTLRITVKIDDEGNHTFVPHLNEGDQVTWIPVNGKILKVATKENTTDLFSEEPTPVGDNWKATASTSSTGTESYGLTVEYSGSNEARDVDPQLQIDQGSAN